MKTEVSVAATFISGLLSSSDSLTGDQLQIFTHTLTNALLEHYQHHWFPQAHCRGSGYRCLRINSELTLWVDPYEVSYRIGEDGSICVLYKSSPLRPKSATSADTSAHRKEKLKTRRSNRSRRFNVMEGSLL
uniref:Anti-proliferative protein domain-containing protein n=1 Tax=Sinocyclocheilus anshuiensis TaxID=1608454 RepID=A0A671QEZ0_9TELE